MQEQRPSLPGNPGGLHKPHVVQPSRPTIAGVPNIKTHHDAHELDPIALDDEPVGGAPAAPKQIRAFGGGDHHKHHDWKRKPIANGTGACRVRSFHGKYSDQGLEYLDNAINEWLDSHPEIEVKFVTSTVMTFEGKVREPALVLNVWY
jgi:hypothetical protein